MIDFDLKGFVLMLVLVGMVLGVGLIVLTQLSTSAKTTETMTNETITIAGHAGTTARDEIQSVTYFGNTTMKCYVFNSASACLNWSADGSVTTNLTFGNKNYNISYTFLEDSNASLASDNVSTAMQPIASTWLALIVTITVLSIILVLVIRAFGGAPR